MARVQYRFTYNNYTPWSEKHLQTWLTDNTKYAVYGREVAPTTGTPHLQGYMSLNKKKTMAALHKSLPVKMALKNADASAAKNRIYCTKDGDFWEHGEIKLASQGCRNDISDFVDETKKRNIEEVALEKPEVYVKYHSGLHKIARIIEKAEIPDIRDVTVTLLYGDPGSGKTYKVYKFAEEQGLTVFPVKNPNGNSIWFDGYCRDPILLIDDFKSWIPYHFLLRLLDCYKLDLPVKSGHTYAYFKYVFITSNVDWPRWYNQDGNLDGYEPGAIERRIHNSYLYGGKYPDVTITAIKETKN